MQLRTSDGVVVKGIEGILRHLASTLPCSSDRQRQALWPSTGPQSLAMSRTIAMVEPLYFRTLQYVLSLLTPLMRTWEARLAEVELQRWDEVSAIVLLPPLRHQPPIRSSLCALRAWWCDSMASCSMADF